eukprot:c14025_g1_i3.p1 GENE.c14025_g1_i3~~c14025_g1_i3.p1  ORF type:complete len:240 (+),score=22.65 c14025_g1_i3:40-759(+)
MASVGAVGRGFGPIQDLRLATILGDCGGVEEILRTHPHLMNCAIAENGYTALHCAAFNGAQGAIELLLELGANVNATDNRAYTPLHLVSRDDQISTVAVLIHHNANINAVDRDGWTPLMMAVFFGRANVMSYLIRAGASLTHKAKNGRTAYEIAKRAGNYGPLKLLHDEEMRRRLRVFLMGTHRTHGARQSKARPSNANAEGTKTKHENLSIVQMLPVDVLDLIASSVMTTPFNPLEDD